MASNQTVDSNDTLHVTRVDANGIGAKDSITVGALLSSGLGFPSGSGGAVTQITSRTTGVTVNALSGTITLVSAAGSATPATFTVTNSSVAVGDVIVLNQASGTDHYHTKVTSVTAGHFDIDFNTTGGTTTEQPVFNFIVLKGAPA